MRISGKFRIISAAIAALMTGTVLGVIPAHAQSTVDTPIAILPIAPAEIFLPDIVSPVIVSDAGTTVTWVPGNGLDIISAPILPPGRGR